MACQTDVIELSSVVHEIFHSYHFLFGEVFTLACSNNFLALAIIHVIPIITDYFMCFGLFETLLFLWDFLNHF